MLTFLELSQGRVEELTSLLSELIGTPLTTEMTYKWLGLDFQSKVIPHDVHTKLIDRLSEDPDDLPASFIPIIERHNARFEKAHLLHTATRPTIEQKWAEGATLKDIGPKRPVKLHYPKCRSHRLHRRHGKSIRQVGHI